MTQFRYFVDDPVHKRLKVVRDANYNEEENLFTLEWRSEPGVFYSVDRWDDIINKWGELEDALFSEDTTMSFEDTSLEEGQTRAIYRVRISETE